ncbi:DNA polymerase I [secondary endosymbiont of Heteropsylla cubana]|uniref:DNA polymerase I n=1 Tax=secondary endosymbiont of Heteropsylla cubana TaxID=134287 RepID=J3YSZ2_9ENTR|nr:DNA polymerase I [secondary endosymbiont of Heteropsylla cubana]AFP85473.1 DNA polymerase I [secondary endosymbiont of Heteropsylla cubana]
MVKTAKKLIILVDGSFYLYRAYYAFPSLINSKNESTGAIYGVLHMLRSLMIKWQPSQIAVIFDAPNKTFRHQLFKDYKAHRAPMPDDLISQIKPLHDMIKAMGLSLLEINGFEADDIIGTLAIAAERSGLEVLISTGDKDMAQLVSNNISLINTASNVILKPEDIKLKFGVPPQLISDYLALIGDKTDNIPGVPGIGRKTAQILLEKIGGVKILYKKLDIVSDLSFRGAKTIANNLKKYQEVAFISYELATIKTDVPLDFSYTKFEIEEPKIEVLIFLFQRYEFKFWINELKNMKWPFGLRSRMILPSTFINSPCPKFVILTEKLSKSESIIIDNIVILKEWISIIRKNGIFYFNTKTYRNDTFTTNIMGFFFAIQSGEKAYLPIGHNYLNVPKQLDLSVVLSVLKPILEDSTINKIGQNLKFVYKILEQYNIKLTGMNFDTMLESYIIDSAASGGHEIDVLVQRFLQDFFWDSKKNVRKKSNQTICNTTSIEKAMMYGGKNADAILLLHKKLWSRINQIPKVKKVFETIEMPLVPVLSRIENIGVLVDQSILATYSLELSKRLEKLERKAHQLAKESFNLSSNREIQMILYEKQKLPVLKKTSTGSPSTSQEVLTKLITNDPIVKIILEYRRLYKLKSTYADGLQKMIHPSSKRIHTSYHQAITVTGRLSSRKPNLQNIPVRDDEGRHIRNAFIATPGTLFIIADYSQIELRIMAHISRDATLLKAFSVNKDIHSVTASEIFNISIEEVTKNHRRIAKTINFGLIYGMSAFGLSRTLSIIRAEAEKYKILYFNKYPGVREYIERICQEAKLRGYVETLNGRRIYLPNICSSHGMHKKAAERAAINAPIQGTAAEIIKKAMITIDNWLQKELLPIRIIMQVHDELIFEAQHDFVKYALIKIKKIMEDCFELDIPLRVDIGVGKNWNDAHNFH